jgi:hypothetical protein
MTFGIVIMILTGWKLLMLFCARYTSTFVLIFRSLICFFICYVNYARFEGMQVCNEPVVIQIKHYQTISDMRTFIQNLYIIMSVFLTPLCAHYLTTHTVVSVIFASELIFINQYYTIEGVTSRFYIPLWVMLMTLSTYTLRRVLT